MASVGVFPGRGLFLFFGWCLGEVRMAAFTLEQVAYLESLPAVESVRGSRIRYTDAFRRECLARYARGEHPVALFREAGLDPRIVGYKRIERAFARWRSGVRMPAKRSAGRPVADDVVAGFGVRASVAGNDDAVADAASLEGDDAAGTVGDAGDGAVGAGTAAFGGRDPRDVLIVQQMHYIQYLEQRLAQSTNG